MLPLIFLQKSLKQGFLKWNNIPDKFSVNWALMILFYKFLFRNIFSLKESKAETPFCWDVLCVEIANHDQMQSVFAEKSGDF